MCYLLFCINVFISLRFLQYLNIFINKTYKTIKVHLVCLLLLCYSTQGGTGGVSFANKNVSGLQKYLRFQNEYNKVEIELRVVQFWTEIKLVITNRTPASRSCDFVITRLISVQIALHSVQLPLLIKLTVFILTQHVNFFVGGNRSTRRKPTTFGKSSTNSFHMGVSHE